MSRVCWYCGGKIELTADGLVPEHAPQNVASFFILPPPEYAFCPRTGETWGQTPSPEWLSEAGYSHPKILPSGVLTALQQFTTTWGLIVGISGEGHYKYRFCFPSLASALAALLQWDGTGDPVGPWIKQKGAGIDRMNPALADDFAERRFRGVAVRAQK